MRLIHAAVFCIGLMAAPNASAGDGSVTNNGAINFTINVRYSPNSKTFERIKKKITDESDRICDATDGQMYYGDVTVETGTSSEDQADFWLYARDGRASSSLDGMGTDGKHGTIWGDDLDISFSHELGHYVFDLGDEYNDPCRASMGRCIDSGNPKNHSLMQEVTPGVANSDHNEFCVSGNHDPNQGSTNSCPVSGGCSGCSNSSYILTSGQEQRHGESCWETIDSRYSFVSAPPVRPTPTPPSNCPKPEFHNDLDVTDYTMLLLDRSGSMKYPSAGPLNGEICDNSIDDDGDGSTDEDDCEMSRHFYLKESAKAWLDLAADTGMNVGITTFSSGTTVDAPFAELESGGGNNLTQFKQIVEGLSPGSDTAIGSAIHTTITQYQGVTGASKAGLLVSDGHETANSHPIQEAQAAEADDIRLFTISTGDASSSGTLANVASEASGRLVDSPQITDLVSFFAQAWAKQQNWPLLIPRAAYMVNKKAKTDHYTIPGDAWFDGVQSFPYGGAKLNTKSFRVPANTDEIKFVFAGNNDNMNGFDILVKLKDPSGNLVNTEGSALNWEVTHEDGYIQATYTDPPAGSWEMYIQPGINGGDDYQQGNITAIAVNPSTELFVDVSPKVPQLGESVDVTVNPVHSTSLNDLASAQLVAEAPDGTKSYFPLTQSAQTFPVGAGETLYTATVPDFIGLAGVYDLRILTKTGNATWNQPGEPIDDGPSNQVTVPHYLAGRPATFYRPTDPKHKPPGKN